MKIVLVCLVLEKCLGLSSWQIQSPKSQLQEIFEGKGDEILVDPKTKTALSCSRRLTGSRVQVEYSSEGKRYGYRNGIYLDLVAPITAPSFKELRETAISALRTSSSDLVKVQTFRSPLTAFLYERGWRDSFERNGFPGPDEEFNEFKNFANFDDMKQNEIVLDLSCGTGLFTRRIFTATPPDTRVIAADYSEAMLLEANRRFQMSFGDAAANKKPKIDFIRVDVANLPFADNSIDAIHCGAALHCYPELEAGLSEIYRVLKPNGTFFATTFLKGAMGTPVTDGTSGTLFGRGSAAENTGFRFFSLDELSRLAREAGFADVDVRREGSFCAVIKCRPDLFEADVNPEPAVQLSPLGDLALDGQDAVAAAGIQDIPSA